LRFIGKEAYISDWFGEKLNERHVRQALGELLARYTVQPVFAMVACDDAGTSHLTSSRFAYTLFIEAPEIADDTLKCLGYELETALQDNYHYHYCRELGQLGSLRLFRIAGGAVAAYLAACQAHGQRTGDTKLVALHRLGGWAQVFQGQMVELGKKC
jgi:hypothetical protein